MQERGTWLYQGPVSKFGKCICNNYVAGTQAVSYAEAETNIKHHYRKDNNLAKNVPLSLEGVLYRVPKQVKEKLLEQDYEQLSMFK